MKKNIFALAMVLFAFQDMLAGGKEYLGYTVAKKTGILDWIGDNILLILAIIGIIAFIGWTLNKSENKDQ